MKEKRVEYNLNMDICCFVSEGIGGESKAWARHRLTQSFNLQSGSALLAADLSHVELSAEKWKKFPAPGGSKDIIDLGVGLRR